MLLVDPVRRRRLLWAQIRAIAAEGVTVLLVTHNVLEAERSVNCLAILGHATVIAEGTPASLKSALGGDLRLELALELSISPLVVPAFVLVALTASCVGYAIASLAPPTLTTILTQALVVFVLMFSPLNFPPERLPDWLRAVHAVLPIQAMGEVIRGSLASTTFTVAAVSFALLGAWCLAGFAIAFVTLNHRG